ncbi:MAG: HEAT repeat domain-containing protein [Gammaproteobacteria bacterium]|nr:HEAT repeat domain-containing protein [Gammaproteobacteria bacterium]
MTQQIPDALLLITPTCPHCPAVLQGLTQLLKETRLGTLEVVNINAHPERAEALGVRGVPWMRIGEFELEGSHTPSELKTWVERAGSPSGVADYFTELLDAGQLAKATEQLKQHPEWMTSLIDLVRSGESGISVRLGIGAMFEDLAGSELLKESTEALAGLLDSDNHGVRADAVHYLGLTRNPAALPRIKQALDDAEEEVREIAAETLTELSNHGIA